MTPSDIIQEKLKREKKEQMIMIKIRIQINNFLSQENTKSKIQKPVCEISGSENLFLFCVEKKIKKLFIL